MNVTVSSKSSFRSFTNALWGVMLIKSEEFWQLFITYADVKRLSASDLVSVVGHCAHRQLHSTECLTIPLTCWTIFCIIRRCQKHCSHLISHTHYSAPTAITNHMPAVFMMCISAHLHYISNLTLPKHLMLLCSCEAQQYSDFITYEEENLIFLYMYCGCNSQGSLSVETWGVLSE